MIADRDPGDGEHAGHTHHLDAWHQSMAPARVPDLSDWHPTEAGRRTLAELRAQTRRDDAARADRRQAVPVASWPALPELYRRMVARAAGLGVEVVDRIDRDLTEREKVMLRSAASDMRAWLNTLVTL